MFTSQFTSTHVSRLSENVVAQARNLNTRLRSPAPRQAGGGRLKVGRDVSRLLFEPRFMRDREGIRVSKKASRREGRWQRMNCAETQIIMEKSDFHSDSVLERVK